MSCYITYKGKNYTQEDFLEYLKSRITGKQQSNIVKPEVSEVFNENPELSIELEDMDWFVTVMDWSNIPDKLKNFLKENWDYTAFDEQVCPHCNYIQDFCELEEDWLNPFHPERELRFPENKLKKESFELIKVKLNNDILADMDFSYSTEHDDLLYFSQKKESDFSL